MVIFDASRHFQAPSPDAAFAINKSEELLADSAQQDCSSLPTPGLSRGTGLSAMAPGPNSCLLWGKRCDCSVDLGVPFHTWEGGKARGLRSLVLILFLPRVWFSLAHSRCLTYVYFSLRSQFPLYVIGDSNSTKCTGERNKAGTGAVL